MGNQQVPGGSATLNLKPVAVAEPPCVLGRPLVAHYGIVGRCPLSTVLGGRSGKLTGLNPSYLTLGGAVTPTLSPGWRSSPNPSLSKVVSVFFICNLVVLQQHDKTKQPQNFGLGRQYL